MEEEALKEAEAGDMAIEEVKDREGEETGMVAEVRVEEVMVEEVMVEENLMERKGTLTETEGLPTLLIPLLDNQDPVMVARVFDIWFRIVTTISRGLTS